MNEFRHLSAHKRSALIRLRQKSHVTDKSAVLMCSGVTFLFYLEGVDLGPDYTRPILDLHKEFFFTFQISFENELAV